MEVGWRAHSISSGLFDMHFFKQLTLEEPPKKGTEPGVPKRSLLAELHGLRSQMSSSNKPRSSTQLQEKILKIPSHHSNGLQMGREASCHFLLLVRFLSSVWNFMSCFPY